MIKMDQPLFEQQTLDVLCQQLSYLTELKDIISFINVQNTYLTQVLLRCVTHVTSIDAYPISDLYYILQSFNYVQSMQVPILITDVSDLQLLPYFTSYQTLIFHIKSGLPLNVVTAYILNLYKFLGPEMINRTYLFQYDNDYIIFDRNDVYVNDVTVFEVLLYRLYHVRLSLNLGKFATIYYDLEHGPPNDILANQSVNFNTELFGSVVGPYMIDDQLMNFLNRVEWNQLFFDQPQSPLIADVLNLFRSALANQETIHSLLTYYLYLTGNNQQLTTAFPDETVQSTDFNSLIWTIVRNYMKDSPNLSYDILNLIIHRAFSRDNRIVTLLVQYAQIPDRSNPISQEIRSQVTNLLN